MNPMVLGSLISAGGSLLGGLLGGKSSSRASNKAAQQNAKAVAWANAIKPVDIYGPYGSVNWAIDPIRDDHRNIVGYGPGTNLRQTLAPKYQEMANQYSSIGSNMFQDIGGYNISNYTDKYLNLMRELASPYERQQTEGLESRLLNRGMLGGMAGERQVQSNQRALYETDLNRTLQADQAAVDRYKSMFDIYNVANENVKNIEGLPYQYMQSAITAAGLGGSQVPNQDYQLETSLSNAAGMARMFANLGQGLGNAAQAWMTPKYSDSYGYTGQDIRGGAYDPVSSYNSILDNYNAFSSY